VILLDFFLLLRGKDGLLDLGGEEVSALSFKVVDMGKSFFKFCIFIIGDSAFS
jgi:hypothetical protein